MTIIIPLTQNQVTIVSDEDADLAELKWYALLACDNGGKYKVVRTVCSDGKRAAQLMHRVILARVLGRELSANEQVDHINGNPLDNRRGNLRLATNGQNGANKSTYRNNTTGYKGVGFDKQHGKYRAQIQHNKHKINLGYFPTPELAHEAYCEAARELHGQFANFGTHTSEDTNHE